MKVGVHTTHYPFEESRPTYTVGGGEHVARRVAEGMADRGHEVRVYTAGAPKATQECSNSVDIKRFRSFGRIGNASLSPGQLIPPNRDTDIVHVHNTTPPGMISGIIHSVFTDTPLVVTHHGHDRYTPTGSLPRRIGDYLYVNLLLDRILRSADRITIPSMTYLEESERLSQFNRKIREVPNGIDPSKFENTQTLPDVYGVTDDDFLVLFVGNLIEKKGPETLLEAVSRMDHDVECVIAGTGPLEEELRRQSPENVQVPGHVSESDKRALFQRADLFCLPSNHRTEVFPIAVLEAYASATPVIVSSLSTFDRFVEPDRTGFRVPRADPDALGDTIAEAFENRSLLDDMTREAKQASAQYCWETVCKNYEDLFLSLID